MANPQCEDGFTKIANEIMDALISHRLSGQEFQIVYFVLRKTYGFGKKCDFISMGQISKATGISRPKVCKLLNNLYSKNILSVVQKGNTPVPQKDNSVTQKDNTPVTQKDNTAINCLCFQKDYEKWKVLPKRIPVTQKDNTPVPQKDNKGVPQKVTHKRKKETYTKEKNVADQKAAFDLATFFLDEVLKNNPFSRLHRLSANEKAQRIKLWGKDINLLLSKDEQSRSIVEEVIRFATNNNFWRANILSGRKLREKWDTLTTQMKTKGISNSSVSNFSTVSSQCKREPSEKLSAEERLTSDEVKALISTIFPRKIQPLNVSQDVEQLRKEELQRQAKELIA